MAVKVWLIESNMDNSYILSVIARIVSLQLTNL